MGNKRVITLRTKIAMMAIFWSLYFLLILFSKTIWGPANDNLDFLIKNLITVFFAVLLTAFFLTIFSFRNQIVTIFVIWLAILLMLIR